MQLAITDGKGYCKVCGDTARFEVQMVNTPKRPVCRDHKETIVLYIEQGNAILAEMLLR